MDQDITFRPHSRDEAQAIAGRAHHAALQLLTNAHVIEAERTRSRDAGPVIQGVFAGTIQFALENTTETPAHLRQELLRLFDILAPQIARELQIRQIGAEGSA